MGPTIRGEAGLLVLLRSGLLALLRAGSLALPRAGLLALLRPVGGPFSSNPRSGLVDASPGGVTASGGFDDMWRGYIPS